MTDEQITKAAEDFAYKESDGLSRIYYPCRRGYVAGAHSRDREVMDLEHLLKAERTTNKVLVEANEQLRNPWISVNDRLPDKINKFMSEPVLCRYTRGSKEYFHVSQYDFEFDEWQISNVTHWMPIPELKKGGEQ